MNKYGIKPPEALSFSGHTNLSEAFTVWEQKFRYYLLATEKDKKKKKKEIQVAVLLTCLGDEGLVYL